MTRPTNDQRYQFLRDRFALESSNDEADFAALAHLNGDEFDAALDAAMLKAGFEIAQEVEPVACKSMAAIIDALQDLAIEVQQERRNSNYGDRNFVDAVAGINRRYDDRLNMLFNSAHQAVNAELLEALRLILPMAKGYCALHTVGSNAAYCEQAEAAIQKAEGAKP